MIQKITQPAKHLRFYTQYVPRRLDRNTAQGRDEPRLPRRLSCDAD